MSGAVLEAPRTLFEAVAGAAAAASAPGAAPAAAPAGTPHGLGAPRGRRTTLEELLDARLREVSAAGEAECPVCTATLHASGDQARCDGCGSTLA